LNFGLSPDFSIQLIGFTQRIAQRKAKSKAKLTHCIFTTQQTVNKTPQAATSDVTVFTFKNLLQFRLAFCKKKLKF